MWPAEANNFPSSRIAGLYSRNLGQVATVLTPKLEARILEATGRAEEWSNPLEPAQTRSTPGTDQPCGKEIQVIADNLSAHKRRPITDFRGAHPKVHWHFTATYSSGLNLVELWFGKIERNVIARGVFNSVSDLKRKREVEIC